MATPIGVESRNADTYSVFYSTPIGVEPIFLFPASFTGGYLHLTPSEFHHLLQGFLACNADEYYISE